MQMIHPSILALSLALLAGPLAAQGVMLPVRLGPSAAGGPQSGRLLVFAQKVEAGEKAVDDVDTSEFIPAASIAAREVEGLVPGALVTVDGETGTFPAAFSGLPPGRYRFQAVLDRNHDYNFDGRGGGDLVSPVVEASLPGPVPTLVLDKVVPDKTVQDAILGLPPESAALFTGALDKARAVDFTSQVLSTFWGRSVHIRGWVALPPGYKPGGARFPVVYSAGGFGADLLNAQMGASRMRMLMEQGKAPPMIWVFLDESTPVGTHEFADSVNNGPWGQALVTEFIPWIERHYATDGVASSRFLTGHSSGGWASLWLQVRYPAVFGGSWPTSPDPVDFHDFIGIDLYAPGANVYRGTSGNPYPLFRNHGRVIASFEQFSRSEAVIGTYGGQMSSFEWVFSPRGEDGRAQPLFDRATGVVDANVAGYWRDHYDIANIVSRDWGRLKPDLDGKVHLYVGSNDSFYLDGAARRLQAIFQRLGAHEEIRFVPDRTHFDLFSIGDDPQGLLEAISWEMYTKARPGTVRPAAVPELP